MQILTCEVGSQIELADGIFLTIVAASNRRVLLGVTAPQSVPVDREELRQRQIASNQTKGAKQ